MAHHRPAALMSGGSADDVETAFYEALQAGDVERLMACWADDDDIVCVHPGGARLLGAAAIRGAFEAIFAQGSLHVKISGVRRIQTLTSAVHSVCEAIEVLLPDGRHGAQILATNVYQKTPEGWRMVAHHASPGTDLEGAPSSPTGTWLH
ncbi:YybH family protein [Acidovorax lacteus]